MKTQDIAIRQSSALAVPRANIGELLLKSGKFISAEDVHRISQLQKNEGLRFGDAAIRLGLVTEDDIRHTLSQQFDYPCMPPDSITVDDAVIAAIKPHDPLVEGLRTLRSQILLRWYTEHNHMVVTSPSAGQGTSRIAANLAVVFSQLGTRTLLIDADMRNPRQHELFQLRGRPGLSDILAGRSSFSVIRGIAELRGLFVLPAGTEPPNPQELLGRGTLNELFNRASSQFDVIIVDTPPALDCADAQTLSARTGGALIVARRHHARMADIEEVKQQLATAGAEAIGAVLTDF